MTHNAQNIFQIKQNHHKLRETHVLNKSAVRTNAKYFSTKVKSWFVEYLH